jgi:nucleoside-diphosphate-sugar epimerase/predicted dehydrogenase
MVVDARIPNGLRTRYACATFLEEDFRQILNRPRLQGRGAAVVALPNEFHEEAVAGLLNRGFHILCEKPLALTEASCLRLRDTAIEARRSLAVNMIRRRFPSVVTASRLIEEGFIGQVRSILIEHGDQFRWPALSFAPFLPQNGGVFADMGVHYLDFAEQLAGPLELKSYRDDAHGGVEAEATAGLESQSQVKVHISLSRTRKLANTATLEGTSGRIVLNVDSLSSASLYRPSYGAGWQVSPIQDRDAGPEVSFAACFVDQIEAFRKRIEMDSVSVTDAEAASRSARIIQEAYQRRSVLRSSVVHRGAAGLERGPVAITGASGFIGSHLAAALFEQGLTQVTGAVRRPHTCASVARYPIDLRLTNLLELDAVRELVRGQRYIFHLAYGRDGADGAAVTVRGTQNVINAGIEAGCEAIVVLSTINVFGWPEGEIDETAPYRPIGGSYGETKAAMERWCLKRSATSRNTRIVLLLPSCVYGPGGKTFTELPRKLASEGAFAWIANGSGTVNYVYVQNLIDAMFLAAAVPAAHGERFIINDGWTTWRNFLEPIVSEIQGSIPSFEPSELSQLDSESRRGALHRVWNALTSNRELRHEVGQSFAGPLLRAVASRARAGAPSDTNQWPPLGSSTSASSGPIRPPVWLEDLFGDRRTRFSSAKARSVLGWRPRIELREGQRIASESLRQPTLISVPGEPCNV